MPHKVFENADKTLGTMVVLKGRPEDYLQPEQTYCGEFDFPEPLSDDINYNLAHRFDEVGQRVFHDRETVRQLKLDKLEENKQAAMRELVQRNVDLILVLDDAERTAARNEIRAKIQNIEYFVEDTKEELEAYSILLSIARSSVDINIEEI